MFAARFIEQLVKLSGLRDRTALNRCIMETVVDMVQPEMAILYRIMQGGQRILLQVVGHHDGKSIEILDAYLPIAQLVHPLETNGLIRNCVLDKQPKEMMGEFGICRLCIPVSGDKNIRFVLELHISRPLQEKQSLLNSLLTVFSNHIGLIDYSETDTLTGLMNRKTFDEHMFRILGRAHEDVPEKVSFLPKRRKGGTADSNEGKTHWLVVADIDHFKQVNDSHGHLVGDEVLIQIARLMRETLRVEDQLFRFGGEEFVAILQPASAHDVLDVLQRIRQTVEHHVFAHVGHITISLGVTAITEGDTATHLLDRADEALYYAKEHGRNQVCSYEMLHASTQAKPSVA